MSCFVIVTNAVQLRQVFDYVPLNDSDIASLRSEFNAMDKDEDGHLSRSDVMALVGSTAILGLQHVKADLQAQGNEAVSKPTAKFLQQLDLLDKVSQGWTQKQRNGTSLRLTASLHAVFFFQS